MAEKKKDDYVLPGQKMRDALVAMQCHVASGQCVLVAKKSGVRAESVRLAALGKAITRLAWDRIAAEIGV